LYRHTLASVPFGITLMALIAIYIAIGSGFPSVRSHFEMSDLQFFNAWPLKVLMGLLVWTLATVTIERIPFTPPRYGVWCVHAGIITLIAGMAYYYTYKIEGQVIVPLGQTVDHFYDGTDRALYVRLSGINVGQDILWSLPRYHDYSPELGNAD
jgi:cytochrome c biogenesis factor